jgi:hypothetical protein
MLSDRLTERRSPPKAGARRAGAARQSLLRAVPGHTASAPAKRILRDQPLNRTERVIRAIKDAVTTILVSSARTITKSPAGLLELPEVFLAEL